ncbi:MAG: methyltransferase domain-containing protein [Elusimicrobia bacterium]|nr:methyltransferase domain-containing protein [Elusimicrobiota bacterium]
MTFGATKQTSAKKTTGLNLGCGSEILDDHINVDIAPLNGVDVVHDLKQLPWPFKDSTFETILAKHILEHFAAPIAILDEIWRIAKPQARITIRVPYWNSMDYASDPTHIHPFHQTTFEFFDPSKSRCQLRPYYAKARFKILNTHYYYGYGKRYYLAKDGTWLHGVLDFLGNFLNNIIRVLEIEMETIKTDAGRHP